MAELMTGVEDVESTNEVSHEAIPANSYNNSNACCHESANYRPQCNLTHVHRELQCRIEVGTLAIDGWAVTSGTIFRP